MSKKMIINLSGKRIGCVILNTRKNTISLEPEGKKGLFKGVARITIPKSYKDDNMQIG